MGWKQIQLSLLLFTHKDMSFMSINSSHVVLSSVLSTDFIKQQTNHDVVSTLECRVYCSKKKEACLMNVYFKPDITILPQPPNPRFDTSACELSTTASHLTQPSSTSQTFLQVYCAANMKMNSPCSSLCVYLSSLVAMTNRYGMSVNKTFLIAK